MTLPPPGSPSGRLVVCARLVDRGVVHERAFLQLDHSVWCLAHEIEIVRRHHDGGAARVDVSEQLEDTARRALVQVAGGLVSQEHRRLIDQCPRDGDALLLAARQLARVRLRLRREADLREHAHHARRDCRGARARHFERERDVLFGGAVLEQPEILKYDAELAAQHGDIAGAHLVHVVSRNAHLARRGALVGVDELHDRRFARAGVAGEEGELPFGDMERDVLERQAALGEGLEHVGELDHLVPRQGLGEVRDEIIGILQSQGKSQKSVRDASLRALFRRETGV